MRHPKTMDRERKPIFTPLKSLKIYQFLPKTQKTQKPKTQNPKPKSHDPSKMKFFYDYWHVAAVPAAGPAVTVLR